LRARLLLNNIPFAILACESLSLSVSDTSVSLPLSLITPVDLRTLASNVANLLNTPVKTWRLKLDSLNVMDGNGVAHAWLNDVLGALEVDLGVGELFSDEIEGFLVNTVRSVISSALGNLGA
jgi:hypothetical protein